MGLGAAAAFGVVCRVVGLVLQGTVPTLTITMEVSTPHAVVPDGLLFCDASPQSSEPPFDFAGASLAAVSEGGTQFDSASSVTIPVPSFLSAGRIGMAAVETASLADFLSMDPHYATSFSERRYDDLPEPLFRRAEESAVDGCVLISAEWKADTRYTVSIAASVARNATSASSQQQLPPMWVAPVTYNETAGTIHVRGPKDGAMCPAFVPQNSTSCSVGFALSPRHGGECVDCPGSPGGSSFATSCACPTGRLQMPVGDAACGPTLDVSASAADIGDLASQLCTLFSEQLESLRRTSGDYLVSDAAASATFVDQLLAHGASFLDVYSVESARAQLLSSFPGDGRRMESPARKFGLRPPAGCDECSGGASFVDSRTKSRVEFKDRRFSSLVELRVIGIALVNSGKVRSCPQLYDPSKSADPFVPFPTRSTAWNWRDFF